MSITLVQPTADSASAGVIERRLRHQVAACTLLLNDLGYLGYSGHVAARLPSRPDAFLIQPTDQPRLALSPDDLLVVDLDGRKISGPEGRKPPSEVFLHCEILRARPDINAIVHFHHDLATVFTLVKGLKLQLIKNHAVRWVDGIPTHADPSHVATPALARSLVKTLGKRHALLIRAHGQVVTAEDVPMLLTDCVHFIENAQAMHMAAQLGKVLPLTKKEIADFTRTYRRTGPSRHKLWNYYVAGGRAKGLLPQDWDLGSR
jgi:L-ribulose-5-phosphate 4-epimerase